MVRKKVCIVAPVYFSLGGMGSIVRQLAKVLGERYEVILLSIKWIEDENAHYRQGREYEKIPVHSISESLFYLTFHVRIFLKSVDGRG